MDNADFDEERVEQTRRQAAYITGCKPENIFCVRNYLPAVFQQENDPRIDLSMLRVIRQVVEKGVDCIEHLLQRQEQEEDRVLRETLKDGEFEIQCIWNQSAYCTYSGTSWLSEHRCSG